MGGLYMCISIADPRREVRAPPEEKRTAPSRTGRSAWPRRCLGSGCMVFRNQGRIGCQARNRAAPATQGLDMEIATNDGRLRSPHRHAGHRRRSSVADTSFQGGINPAVTGNAQFPPRGRFPPQEVTLCYAESAPIWFGPNSTELHRR
jgi:hypothetical protein